MSRNFRKVFNLKIPDPFLTEFGDKAFVCAFTALGIEIFKSKLLSVFNNAQISGGRKLFGKLGVRKIACRGILTHYGKRYAVASVLAV